MNKQQYEKTVSVQEGKRAAYDEVISMLRGKFALRDVQTFSQLIESMIEQLSELKHKSWLEVSYIRPPRSKNRTGK